MVCSFKILLLRMTYYKNPTFDFSCRPLNGPKMDVARHKHLTVSQKSENLTQTMVHYTAGIRNSGTYHADKDDMLSAQ